MLCHLRVIEPRFLLPRHQFYAVQGPVKETDICHKFLSSDTVECVTLEDKKRKYIINRSGLVMYF